MAAAGAMAGAESEGARRVSFLIGTERVPGAAASTKADRDVGTTAQKLETVREGGEGPASAPSHSREFPLADVYVLHIMEQMIALSWRWVGTMHEDVPSS